MEYPIEVKKDGYWAERLELAGRIGIKIKTNKNLDRIRNALKQKKFKIVEPSPDVKLKRKIKIDGIKRGDISLQIELIDGRKTGPIIEHAFDGDLPMQVILSVDYTNPKEKDKILAYLWKTCFKTMEGILNETPHYLES